MADLDLTLSKVPADRFIAALERADVAELTRVLDKKKMSTLERDTVRKAHAMLHGNIDEVEVWFETVPEPTIEPAPSERVFARCAISVPKSTCAVRSCSPGSSYGLTKPWPRTACNVSPSAGPA